MWLFFLSLIFSPLAADDPPLNVPIVLRPLPPEVRDELRSLRQQNAELKRIVQTLESERGIAGLFQQRFLEADERLRITLERNHLLQQKLGNLSQEGQARADRDAETIRRQMQEVTLSRTKLQQAELEKQAMIQAQEKGQQELQESQKQREQADRLVQFLRQRVDEVQNRLAQMTKEYEQLQQTQKKVAQEFSREQILLTKQVQSLKRDLDESQMRLDAYQRQFKELGETSQQQLQTQGKRLEAYAKSEKEEYEKQLAQKTASIDKWRETSSQLQAQLDIAVSINSQLRSQVARLQADCETSHLK